MPVRIVSPDNAPKSERKAEKLFEKTRAWKSVKAALDQGYPNETGLIDLAISPDEMVAMGIKSARTITRFLADYINAADLTHRVKVRRREGVSHFLIERTGAKPKKPRVRKG